MCDRGLPPPAAFWAEIPPCEHFVEVYADESRFMENLHDFVGAGLRAGEGVIIIATSAHRAALEAALVASGFDLDLARASDTYIDLDAADTLAHFMVDGWPDEPRFEEVISGVLARARAGQRSVRAFGEMVAVMWAAGQNGAVVRLEHLWHALCKRETFSLYCAYPKAGFTQDAGHAIREICAAHSRLIGAPVTA